MSSKRKLEGDEEGEVGEKQGGGRTLVNPKRAMTLRDGEIGDGPVIYWCSRDQRVADNWALLYAVERATHTGAPVAVAFNLASTIMPALYPPLLLVFREELQPEFVDVHCCKTIVCGDRSLSSWGPVPGSLRSC